MQGIIQPPKTMSEASKGIAEQLATQGDPTDYERELCGDELWARERLRMARAKRWQESRYRRWWMKHEGDWFVTAVLVVLLVVLTAAYATIKVAIKLWEIT